MKHYNKNVIHLILVEHKKFKDYKQNLKKKYKNLQMILIKKNKLQDNKVNGWLKNHIQKIKLFF